MLSVLVNYMKRVSSLQSMDPMSQHHAKGGKWRFSKIVACYENDCFDNLIVWTSGSEELVHYPSATWRIVDQCLANLMKILTIQSLAQCCNTRDPFWWSHLGLNRIWSWTSRTWDEDYGSQILSVRTTQYDCP